MEDSNFYNIFSDKQLEESFAIDEKSNPVSDFQDVYIEANQPFSNNIQMSEEISETSASGDETQQFENASHNCIDESQDSTAINIQPKDSTQNNNALIDNIVCLNEELKARSTSVAFALSDLSDKLDNIQSAVSHLDSYDVAVETLKRSLTANQNTEKKLYEEVEAYKRDIYFTNIKPFLLYLIEMLCEMKSSKKQYEEEREEFIAENNENVYNEICSMLDFYISSFESQLRIQGVTIISYETETKYEAIQQTISKTIPTDDPQMVGVVASVITDCYTYDNKVLKPAKVYVYKRAVPQVKQQADKNTI